MGKKRTEIARDFEIEEIDLLSMEAEFFNEQKARNAENDDGDEVASS